MLVIEKSKKSNRPVIGWVTESERVFGAEKVGVKLYQIGNPELIIEAENLILQNYKAHAQESVAQIKDGHQSFIKRLAYKICIDGNVRTALWVSYKLDRANCLLLAQYIAKCKTEKGIYYSEFWLDSHEEEFKQKIKGYKNLRIIKSIITNSYV